MTSPSDISCRFSRQIFAALEFPESADRNAILEPARAFLDAAQDGPAGLTLARKVAYRAMDYAVFGAPENYRALVPAVHIFSMDCGIKRPFSYPIVKMAPAARANMATRATRITVIAARTIASSLGGQRGVISTGAVSVSLLVSPFGSFPCDRLSVSVAVS